MDDAQSEQKPDSLQPKQPEMGGVHSASWIQSLRELLDLIQFHHTLFALPFALLGAMGAAQGWPKFRILAWILAAMVGARTAAMSFNRIVDREIDALNPRTAHRALPAGRIPISWAWGLFGSGTFLFGLAAGALGPLPTKLAPLALLILLGYSLCKRFTSISHLVLGLALAGAPLGAWIAVNGRLEPPAWWLAAGVLFWTAGFDVFYSLQDQVFDQRNGLLSLPSRFGTQASLAWAKIFHLVALVAWARFNLEMHSHLFPWLAWIVVAFMLAREHVLVRGGRLDRMNQAFFTLNSMVGPVFLAGHALDLLRGWPRV